MRYQIEEYVRWEDIDAAGIINYQAYLRFFGLAEAELFRAAELSYGTLFEELGVWLPRKRVECNFHLPVRLDDLLVVDAYIGKIGVTSLHVDFEARVKGNAQCVADGKYVLVTVAQGSFVPCPVPDEVRRKLGPWLEPHG
jgi:YbgC/YbaW family acyl-CoA thioester hydrolase